MTCTHDIIEAAVRRARLDNQVLCVHSSLRSFGFVEGGALAVVSALLDAGCTVMVPTHSWCFAVPPPDDQRVPRNGWDYESYLGPQEGIGRAYAPSTQEIDRDMGAIAAAVVAMSKRERGDNPIASFSAVGPHARELIEGQSVDDVFYPLRKLAELNGHIVLMGVGLTSMTALHLAEELAGRVPFRRWANGTDGQPMPVAVGGCSDGFVNFEAVLSSLEKRIEVCSSIWRLFPADSLLKKAVDAVRRDPMITHCGRADCLRCADAVAGGPILDLI